MIPFHFEANPAAQSDERRVVVPAQVESKGDLLAFLRNAIPLPDYFGNNWDALEECLGNPDWLGSQKILLLHHDIPLSKTPFDQRTYLQILAEAARGSDRFRIVFPERNRTQIERLLVES